MPLRKDGIETKKKILAVCVRLFLEQGYRETTISQIVEEAGVARGSFQNLFPTKDAVLMELDGRSAWRGGLWATACRRCTPMRRKRPSS